MSRPKRYLTFEGQFENAVLGTFRIIRGFADLRDLARVSTPYEMTDATAPGQVQGQQRQIDPEHAERIKHYIEDGDQRFMPEVILSLRHELDEERDANQIEIGVKSRTAADGIVVKRRWKSQKIRVHQVKVDLDHLEDIRNKKLIRRVDGNHRLKLADTLKNDPVVPKKYLTSFCILLLGAPDNAADDYSESLIFHTINSTALLLESEHALRLICGQPAQFNMTPEKEFAYSPELHFTRLLRDGLLHLPPHTQERLGNRPLTSLRNAARGVLEMDKTVGIDLPSLRTYATELLAALTAIATRLDPDHPNLTRADYFIELAARVWQAIPKTGKHSTRVNTAVTHLAQLATWLGNDGLVELKEGRSLSKQILDIYGAVRTRTPKRVFLARWYPADEETDDKRKADLRLAQIRETLATIKREDQVTLDLIDMGTQTGGTFPIHARMYDAINSSDIILVDLTGVRPNVCVEAGFALRHHEKNRLVFLFQPAKKHNTVPFDLNTYRYEQVKEAAEIPNALRRHITAILKGAAIGV